MHQKKGFYTSPIQKHETFYQPVFEASKKESSEDEKRSSVEEKTETPIVSKRDERDNVTLVELIIILGGILGLMILEFSVSSNTNSSFFIVFFSFLPILLTIITCMILLELYWRGFRYFSWIFPLAYSLLFFFLVNSSTIRAFSNLDATNITAFNVIIGLMFVLVVDIFSKARDSIRILKERTVRKTIVHEKSRNEKENMIRTFAPEKIKEYIQSLEDKCKAMNFVIGRVYKEKNGGSKEARDMIRIPAEWYNQFSELTEENIIKNRDQISDVTFKIMNKLKVMQLPENQVFPEHYHEFKINHDPKGFSSVIEVLIANDKDPVKVYFESAMESCKKTLDEIRSK